MEAEAGVMHLQAKDHWQPPEAARDRTSFKASGRNQPFPHPNGSTPSFEAQLAPELQMNNLYCFKPPSLWFICYGNKLV